MSSVSAQGTDCAREAEEKQLCEKCSSPLLTMSGRCLNCQHRNEVRVA
jgi:hypothetical protein